MKLGPPTAGRRRWAVFLLVPASAAFVAAVTLVALWNRTGRSTAPAPPAPPGLAGWETTSEGDFEERNIDTSGSRLRMRLATRGTDPGTVKFLGLRRREEILLKEGTRIAVDLDWNYPANGSGLSAGIALAPASTAGNPLQLPDCLWVEYIGVPPGKNARLVVGKREKGNHRLLTTEGWPDTNRAGREIGLQKLQVEIGKDRTFRILENGREVFASGAQALPFDRAYLYLQVSSRSNYAPREIYFDNIVVEAAK